MNKIATKPGIKDFTPSAKIAEAPMSKAIKTMRLLQDRVLVLRDPAEDKIGGIYVPETSQEPCLNGTVLAVGPGRRWDDGSVLLTQVKKGDRVIFSGSVNLPYKDLVADGDLIMMNEQDILGVLSEE